MGIFNSAVVPDLFSYLRDIIVNNSPMSIIIICVVIGFFIFVWKTM